MYKILICVMLFALQAGTAFGETVCGQLLFHSKDGKIVGLKSPAGLVALIDGADMQVSGISSIDSIKSCDDVEIGYVWSGKQRIITAIAFKKKAESTACMLQTKPLPVVQMLKALDDHSATVVDVRGTSEYDKAHFDGAINIPLGDIEAKAAELPKDKQIIFYCHSGARAAFATGLLQQKGISSSFIKGKFSVKDGKPQIIE
jgi:rhodanese-related sulfurtransferase